MCGRFTSLLSPELLAAIYDVAAPPDLAPRYNIAPSQPVLIVRQDSSGQRELAPVNWGLIPSWAKDPNIGHSLSMPAPRRLLKSHPFGQLFAVGAALYPQTGFTSGCRQGSQNSPGISRDMKTVHCL